MSSQLDRSRSKGHWEVRAITDYHDFPPEEFSETTRWDVVERAMRNNLWLKDKSEEGAKRYTESLKALQESSDPDSMVHIFTVGRHSLAKLNERKEAMMMGEECDFFIWATSDKEASLTEKGKARAETVAHIFKAFHDLGLNLPERIELLFQGHESEAPVPTVAVPADLECFAAAQMDGRLRELDFGDDEDVTSTRSELEADPMFSGWNVSDNLEKHRALVKRASQETKESLRKRQSDWLQSVMSDLEKSTDIAVVSHNHWIRSLCQKIGLGDLCFQAGQRINVPVRATWIPDKSESDAADSSEA